jgi:hypothetical protein
MIGARRFGSQKDGLSSSLIYLKKIYKGKERGATNV